jgi:hypothetical protein
MKTKIYKAKVTTRKITFDGEVREIIDDLQCGKCDSILYGYDEVICPVCGAYNDFE